MNVVIIGILGLLFLLTVYIVLVVLKVKFVYKSWVWIRKLFGKSLIEQANTACPGYKFSAFGYDKNDERLWDIITGECPVTPTNLNNTVPSTWTATDKAAWIEQAVSNCAPRYPADLLNSSVYTNDDIYRFASTVPCPKGDPATWSTDEGAWWDNMIKTRCSTFDATDLKTNQNKIDFVSLPSCTVTDEFTKKLAKTWCPNLSDTLTNEQYSRIAFTDHTCPVNCVPKCVNLNGKTFAKTSTSEYDIYSITFTTTTYTITSYNTEVSTVTTTSPKVYTISNNTITLDSGTTCTYSIVDGIETLTLGAYTFKGSVWSGDCNAVCQTPVVTNPLIGKKTTTPFSVFTFSFVDNTNVDITMNNSATRRFPYIYDSISNLVTITGIDTMNEIFSSTQTRTFTYIPGTPASLRFNTINLELVNV